MAEQFLDGPDVRPGLEQVRRERVPEGVARHAFRESGPARCLSHRALDRRLVQMKPGWRSDCAEAASRSQLCVALTVLRCARNRSRCPAA
jgi:hypothetical protein